MAASHGQAAWMLDAEFRMPDFFIKHRESGIKHLTQSGATPRPSAANPRDDRVFLQLEP